eukprot:scaffold10483_cov65-Cyclotella_meneghiniana.AAC.4
MKKCARCKAVGYCSVDCQKNDYPNHKALCRSIVGQGPKQSLDLPTERETAIIKERYPQNSTPLSSALNPVKEDITMISGQEQIVLHCLHPSDEPEDGFSGVYQLVDTYPLTYIRNTVATNHLSGKKKMSSLQNFHMQFTSTAANHILTYERKNENSAEMQWRWRSENGGRLCRQATQSRSQHIEFWDDHLSLLHLASRDIFGRWISYIQESSESTMFAAEGGVRAIAVIPVKTLEKAIESGPPKSTPPKKYMQAPDYLAWEQPFVLHANHYRICGVPLDVVDSMMGVYKPIPGRMRSGYPIWGIDRAETAALAKSIPFGVKEYLETKSIRLRTSVMADQWILFVHCTKKGLLSLTVGIEPSNGSVITPVLGNQSILDMNEFLTVSTTLFSTPQKVFSTWSGPYNDHMMTVDVAVTPLEYFEQTVALTEIELDPLGSSTPQASTTNTTKIKKKKNKKKKNRTVGVDESHAAETKQDLLNTDSKAKALKPSNEDEINVQRTSLINQVFRQLVQELNGVLDLSSVQIPTTTSDISSEVDEEWSTEKIMEYLFHSDGTDIPWLQMKNSDTSLILKAALLHDETAAYIREHSNHIIESLSRRPVRQEDLTVLFEADGIRATAKSIATLFSNLQEGAGHQFNNKIAKLLCAKVDIVMESNCDFRRVQAAVNKTVGKNTKRELTEVLKQASARASKPKCLKSKSSSEIELTRNEENVLPVTIQDDATIFEVKTEESQQDKKEQVLLEDFTSATMIKDALKWYSDLLETFVKDTSQAAAQKNDKDAEINLLEEDHVLNKASLRTPHHALTTEEVGRALSMNDISEDTLAEVEAGIDLERWDDTSETWSVDITENAHKADSKKLQLYETKIDSGSRIIWEVALAFSPRRSSRDQHYCEQVIRVWDVVVDHDNLSRAISQTIERIEKCHQRGEECALYSEIDRSNVTASKVRQGRCMVIPRVFPMRQEICANTDKRLAENNGKTNHYHPASHDPRQFTLLKFYELNKGAIKMLLDSQDDDAIDLPFTPGPKEHEIIHYQSKESILLMGRSGTGKTTCLVFRIWAQWISSSETCEQPRQVFLTKNNVLCNEVQRSFNNMGLAWHKRTQDSAAPLSGGKPDNAPKFMTSSEWLDLLDEELLGESFFTPHEREQRQEMRKADVDGCFETALHEADVDGCFETAHYGCLVTALHGCLVTAI